MRLFLFFVAAALQAQPDLAVVEKVSGKVGFYKFTGERTSEVKVGVYPHEIVLSLDGKSLYVTDNGILWMQYAGKGGNTISILDAATRLKTGVIDLGEYRRPHGMAVHPQTGQLVVTVENPDGLLLIDPKERKVLRKFEVQGKSPHMVLFGPGGKRAYVSNTNSGTLASIDIATGEVRLIATGKYPQGGVLSRDGRTIYLTNAESNQIVLVDTGKDRVYLPQDLLARHGVSDADLFARRFSPGFARVMEEACGVARGLFMEGLALPGMVDRRLALDLRLFSHGGLAVLDKIERQGWDVLRERPKIGRWERVGLLVRALWAAA